jgi:hypothetical protein
MSRRAGSHWTNPAERGFKSAGIKGTGGSWFNIAHNTTSGKGQNPDGRKPCGTEERCPGCGCAFGPEAWTGMFKNPDGTMRRWHLQCHQRDWERGTQHEGVKHHGSGAVWFDTGPASLPLSSLRRKFASAMIAKIPLPLSRYIAATFRRAGDRL